MAASRTYGQRARTPAVSALCCCKTYYPPSMQCALVVSRRHFNQLHPTTAASLQAVGASERVFQLLDRAPQMVPAGKAKPSGSPAGGEVQFCNVHFSYPSRPDVQARSLIRADVCHLGQRGVPIPRIDATCADCCAGLNAGGCEQANAPPSAAVCALAGSGLTLCPCAFS